MIAPEIHHDPDCGTSRNVLAILRVAGEPVVIEYLREGWIRPQLPGRLAAAGPTPRAALRVSNAPAEAMGLTDPEVPDDALLDAMVAHPILVNRPIVCTPLGVRLSRPSEAVLEIMERRPRGPVLREDGMPIPGSDGAPA